MKREITEKIKSLSKIEARCLLIIVENFSDRSFTWSEVRTEYLKKYGEKLSREDFESVLNDSESLVN